MRGPRETDQHVNATGLKATPKHRNNQRNTGRRTLTAREVTLALGGAWSGSNGRARCPVHASAGLTLSITDGQNGGTIFHCFAGCSAANVRDAVDARLGKGSVGPLNSSPISEGSSEADAARKAAIGFSIWRASASAQGTLVASYLNARAIRLSPPVLRFCPRLKHGPTGTFWPAMIALVTRASDGKPLGIHRTYIAKDGSGKAPVDPQKMMLGPCKGGIVRLGEPTDELLIGEGIETCLSAMQETGKPAWAALSAGNFAHVALPEAIRTVFVLADNDKSGTGQAAALRLALRIEREGRRARIVRPRFGKDFNDLLMRGAAGAKP
jgi:putative DNA primase/helicase